MIDGAVEHAASFSVVICAYSERRWEELHRAVRSTLAQTVAAQEVIVVIDHNDALLSRARSGFRHASVVGNTWEPGLAGARNTGVAVSSGAVVAFLDDDAEATPTWIEEMQRAYATGKWLGVGGSILPSWPAGRPRWFPPEFDWVVGCTYAGMPAQADAVRNLIGANMSVRREVLQATGGFREELGRLEETEFCIRASAAFPDYGWLYWPAARVKHNILVERTQVAFFFRRCFNEGLAKATMIKLTGSEAGLRSERTYVLRALPQGVVREVRSAIRGDPAGVVRSGVIVTGLLLTIAGFVRGTGLLTRSSQGMSLARRGSRP